LLFLLAPCYPCF